MKKYLLFFMGLFISSIISAQTITGPSLLCSGSYSFSASSWQTGYQWVVSSNLSYSNNTTNPLSVTVNGSGAGYVALYNTNTYPNPTLIYQKNFWIGIPSIYISGSSSIPQYSTGNFYAYPTVSNVDMGITSYEWQISPSPSSYYSSGNYASGVFNIEGSYRVSCRATNACGTSAWVDLYVTVGNRSRAYPNPADDILNIEVGTSSNVNTKGTILNYDIRLYDSFGNILKQTGNIGSGTAQISVSNVPDGIYYLHIYDGVSSTPENLKIIVKH